MFGCLECAAPPTLLLCVSINTALSHDSLFASATPLQTPPQKIPSAPLPQTARSKQTAPINCPTSRPLRTVDCLQRGPWCSPGTPRVPHSHNTSIIDYAWCTPNRKTPKLPLPPPVHSLPLSLTRIWGERKWVSVFSLFLFSILPNPSFSLYNALPLSRSSMCIWNLGFRSGACTGKGVLPLLDPRLRWPQLIGRESMMRWTSTWSGRRLPRPRDWTARIRTEYRRSLLW